MFGRLAMGFANVRAGTRVLMLVLVQAEGGVRGAAQRRAARGFDSYGDLTLAEWRDTIGAMQAAQRCSLHAAQEDMLAARPNRVLVSASCRS